MPASDNLNNDLFGPLYHGTETELPPRARKILPYRQYDPDSAYAGMKVAFATRDIDEAKAFGSHVYEVEADKHTLEGFGRTVYSEKGFKIKRKLSGE